MTFTNAKRIEVLIIGAGPTGLVMASELARRGIPCRIVERATSPSPFSRAIGIQARTLELFENMGIAEKFTTLGHKAHGLHVVAEGHDIVHLAFDKLDSPYPFLLFLPQSETERILTQHLASLGVSPERAVELIGFTQNQQGVETTLRKRDGTEERVLASWLIGCDGAHSTVRHLLGLPFTGTTQESHFLLADVGLRWSQSDDVFTLFLHDDGLLGIFPLGHGRYRIIAGNPPQELSSAHLEPTLEACQALVNRRGPGDITLSDSCWTTYFRISYRMVSEFRQGRVFLAGDAANIHSPAGAQGMNTGIQDAVNLAWKLALVSQEAASPCLLDSYQAERYPVERNVLRQSEFLTEMASVKSPIAQSVRDHLLPMLSGMEVVQERLRHMIAELSIHYHHSAIVEEHTMGGSVVAGDRAPDATLMEPQTGEAIRLFRVWQGTKHVLLLLSGRLPKPETLARLQEIDAQMQSRYGRYLVGCLVVTEDVPPSPPLRMSRLLLDPEHTLHERYGGGSPGMYLIRPDGYVAFRCPLEEANRLLLYMACIFR